MFWVPRNWQSKNLFIVKMPQASCLVLIRGCSGLNCVIPKRYVQVLTPCTHDHDLIWKEGFCSAIKLKWGHTRFRWALIQWLVSLYEGEICTWTHSEGTIWRQRQILEWCCHKIKKYQRLLAGRGKERLFPRALGGAWTCQGLDFTISASRTVRRYVCGNLLWQP